jgi:ABC-type multidrug transport system ATPase subunit
VLGVVGCLVRLSGRLADARCDRELGTIEDLRDQGLDFLPPLLVADPGAAHGSVGFDPAAGDTFDVGMHEGDGRIHLDVGETDAVDHARYRIGLVGQNASVDEILSGRQNLVMFGKLYHLPAATARRRADELLEQFDLTVAADQSVAKYSGGMRRRLDLATSLILAPPVLFLDEPTIGLDPRARIDVWATIRSLVGSGTTVLLTTQYLEEAEQLADQIAVIDAGRVVADGTPDELKAKVGPDRVETITRKPTLDEVFLHLTGHIATGIPEQTAEQAS